MSESSDIRLEYIGIGSLLHNKRLQVPKYQRSYAWEDSHVSEYINDIRKAMSDDESEYFLGSIVATTAGRDSVELVDGQQRLATTSILIAAVRDWFINEDELETAVELEREFLHRRDRRTKDNLPQLTLNDSDHGYFLDRILSKPTSEERKSCKPETRAQSRINNAAQKAANYVKDIVSTTKEPETKLNDLVEFLQHNVKVIWLTAATDANAFVIFETLNDRGLELATSDLLKNYLFSLAGPRIGEAQAHWTSMIATLERVSDDNAVTEFIRYYWSSYHGATRRQELYASIKKQVRTKNKAIELARELDRVAGIYVSMVSLEPTAWKKLGETTRGHMGIINTLGMVQIRPLILSVLDEGMSISETRKTFKAMVSWGVRFLIVGGLGGGTMERHYADAAKLVRAKKATSAKDVGNALVAVIPGDSVFREAFETARVSRANLARYYLQALERAHAGESQPELVPNTNPDEITLEHVLPKNLNQQWQSEFAEEEHAAYYRRVGNLALLSRGENSGSGDDGFAKKKKVLGKSHFNLTKTIANVNDWNQVGISDRQKILAALALKAWPL